MSKKNIFIALCFFVGLSAQAQRYNQKVFTSVTTISDVLYGFNFNYKGDSTKLYLDIYQPAGDTVSSRPLVILAFGGSFLTGSKKAADMVTLCTEFSKRGYVCASIQYRLGIDVTSGNTLEKEFAQAVLRGTQDGRAAVRYFRKDILNGNTYKIDGTNIFFGGVSAGGVLGLHLAFLDTSPELSSIPVDTIKLGSIEGNSGNPGYNWRVKGVISLCGALGNVNWMANNTNVSICSMHGTNDAVVPYKTDYFKIFGANVTLLQGGFSIDSAANKKGMNTRLYTFAGADHVPFDNSTLYMDTTINYVSNYLYKQVTGLPPAGLQNIVEIAGGFNLYPNPAKSMLTISLNQALNQKISVQIFDPLGQLLQEKLLVGNSIELNIQSFKAGLYFVRLTIDNQNITKRFVVE